uniref:Uncharacterized protein n=1 Tax=Ganoderma boninense TaxID=34458 RepID=A0A5K1K4C9_9APHY|nr:Uncharacterized protein [Ganoderma boninense]
MTFLDELIRDEIGDFIECSIHSLDSLPSSPTPNGVVTASDTITVTTPGPVEEGPNTVFLAQKFLSLVAALSNDAPHPDDLFSRFRHVLTTLLEHERLSPDQLRAFDVDYSFITRTRGLRSSLDHQHVALLALEHARNTLRDAQAQRELHETAQTVAALASAEKMFEDKRQALLGLARLARRSIRESESFNSFIFFFATYG